MTIDDYDNAILTTLDGRNGSSGGGLYAADGAEDGDHLFHFGVSHASVAPGTWSNTHSVSPERPDSEHFHAFAFHSSPSRDQAQRDHPGPGGDPDNPQPHVGSPPGFQTCEDNEGVIVSNDTFGCPQATPIASGEADPVDLPPASPPESFDEGGAGPEGNYRVSCSPAYDAVGLDVPGVAVGLAGSPTTSSVTSETIVGDLGLICSPWYHDSWTKNLRWLVVMGHNMKGDVGNGPGWLYGDLVEEYLQMYEIRNREGTDEVRPMSMKTCPPNYFLDGFRMAYGDIEGEPTLVGITDLRCQSPAPSPQAGQSVDVPLSANPSNQPHAWYEDNWYDDYEMGGKPFTLDQRIGYPTYNHPDMSVDFEWIECDTQGEVMTGLTVDRDHQDGVKTLKYGCGPIPTSP